MGGSAQNTILSCIGLSGKYEIVLAHGLSHESKMTDTEIETINRHIEKAKDCGVELFSIPSLIRKIDPLKDFFSFISLLKLIKKEKPVIVHTHSSKAGLVGRLAAWITRVPIIIHTPHGHVFFGHFGKTVSRLFLYIEKLADLITDHMVALTTQEKRDYVEFSVAATNKISIIHSGIDLETFSETQTDIAGKKNALGLNGQTPIVGTVGWLLPIKGPGILLEAMGYVWEQYPESQLVYVGKGDLEEDLKVRASGMGVSGNVKFLGWRNDVGEIIHTFDIFVLPSLNEGMGRVIVEAMAAGKPVVASNTGGIPDLVKNEESGFLFPPGNEKVLAESIMRLLKDPELAEVMGQRGRLLSQDFSTESMIRKIEQLYDRLLLPEPCTSSLTSSGFPLRGKK